MKLVKKLKYYLFGKRRTRGAGADGATYKIDATDLASITYGG